MTLEEVAARKKIEFQLKLSALEKEFKEWCDISEKDNLFEKHNSQIRSVRAHLEPWNRDIRIKLENYENRETDVFLKNCKNAVSLTLSAHRIWDYFRQKFIQRKNESFRRYLRTADEFAWACYKPIQLETKSELKEPPLVFFNGGTSPFTVPREHAFQTELVDGKDLSAEISNREIPKLPISVIGIPWDQINHLAEASVIGHEVGHIVENDFKMTEDLKRLLAEALSEAQADDSRKVAWNSWLSEIFDDLYGCLSVGAAYAGTLLDYLIDEKFTIENQERKPAEWTAYPTDFLRMKFIFKVLEKMRFKDETKNYSEIYSVYSSKMPHEFEKDIDFVADKLLFGKLECLNDKAITNVFNFTPEQQKQVKTTAKRILENTPAQENEPALEVDLKTTDIRVLIAANRLSYEESPQQHAENKYDEVILDWSEENIIEKGVRSGVILSNSDIKLAHYKKIGEESIQQIITEMFD